MRKANQKLVRYFALSLMKLLKDVQLFEFSFWIVALLQVLTNSIPIGHCDINNEFLYE